MARKFPPKSPAEIKLCTFDFAPEMAPGSVLSSPTVVKSLIEGTDVGAASLTVGTPGVAGTLLKVIVGAGLDLNKYGLLATVDADNGERHQIAATLSVKVSAA